MCVCVYQKETLVLTVSNVLQAWRLAMLCLPAGGSESRTHAHRHQHTLARTSSATRFMLTTSLCQPSDHGGQLAIEQQLSVCLCVCRATTHTTTAARERLPHTHAHSHCLSLLTQVWHISVKCQLTLRWREGASLYSVYLYSLSLYLFLLKR